MQQTRQVLCFLLDKRLFSLTYYYLYSLKAVTKLKDSVRDEGYNIKDFIFFKFIEKGK